MTNQRVIRRREQFVTAYSKTLGPETIEKLYLIAPSVAWETHIPIDYVCTMAQAGTEPAKDVQALMAEAGIADQFGQEALSALFLYFASFYREKQYRPGQFGQDSKAIHGRIGWHLQSISHIDPAIAIPVIDALKPKLSLPAARYDEGWHETFSLYLALLIVISADHSMEEGSE